MTDQIKRIIKNYLNNVKLPSVVQGIKTADGVKISDVLTIPDELVYVPTWLRAPETYLETEEAKVGEASHKHEFKQHVELAIGDTVYMLRNLGGQSFFVLDVIKS